MKLLRQTQHTHTHKRARASFSSPRMRRRVTGKVCTDIWKDRSDPSVRVKQTTKIHIRLLYSVDSLRRNSYVPPADLCSGYTLHSKVGEVAAAARRSTGRNVNCSIFCCWCNCCRMSGIHINTRSCGVCVCVRARACMYVCKAMYDTKVDSLLSALKLG
jgi:hypothetical protein